MLRTRHPSETSIKNKADNNNLASSGLRWNK